MYCLLHYFFFVDAEGINLHIYTYTAPTTHTRILLPDSLTNVCVCAFEGHNPLSIHLVFRASALSTRCPPLATGGPALVPPIRNPPPPSPDKNAIGIKW